MPGQTSISVSHRRSSVSTFNGGPDKCPAKRLSLWHRGECRRGAFNGGPDNCPAKRGGRRRRPQLVRGPSMEGRTIARPNGRTCTSPRRTCTTFNGGPDNCPAKRRNSGGALRLLAPSMEGRTIARPNAATLGGPSTRGCPFNGGPDNCPAKHAICMALACELTILQWRAGQLPGQTPARRGQPARGEATFNGGPDNCPAKRVGQGNPQVARSLCLQWRAGQLPGQTRRTPAPPGSRRSAFNGGPDNCPAKLFGVDCGGVVERLPSMEGRTIARPNTPTAAAATARRFLQWRAGQLPGQTCTAGCATPTRLRAFNGGPDNCPAKPGRG